MNTFLLPQDSEILQIELNYLKSIENEEYLAKYIVYLNDFGLLKFNGIFNYTCEQINTGYDLLIKKDLAGAKKKIIRTNQIKDLTNLDLNSKYEKLERQQQLLLKCIEKCKENQVIPSEEDIALKCITITEQGETKWRLARVLNKEFTEVSIQFFNQKFPQFQLNFQYEIIAFFKCAYLHQFIANLSDKVHLVVIGTFGLIQVIEKENITNLFEMKKQMFDKGTDIDLKILCTSQKDQCFLFNQYKTQIIETFETKKLPEFFNSEFATLFHFPSNFLSKLIQCDFQNRNYKLCKRNNIELSYITNNGNMQRLTFNWPNASKIPGLCLSVVLVQSEFFEFVVFRFRLRFKTRINGEKLKTSCYFVDISITPKFDNSYIKNGYPMLKNRNIIKQLIEQ